MILLRLLIALLWWVATNWRAVPVWLRFGLPIALFAVSGVIHAMSGIPFFLGYIPATIFMCMAIWGTMDDGFGDGNEGW